MATVFQNKNPPPTSFNTKYLERCDIQQRGFLYHHPPAPDSVVAPTSAASDSAIFSSGGELTLERHRGHSRLTDQRLTQCLILLGSQSFCVKLLNKSLLHWCLGADIVNDHTQQQMPWLLTTMNCFTELWTTICFTYCGLFPARRDSRPHSWAEMMEKCVNVTVTPIKEKNANHNWIWIATTQFGLISKNVFMKLLLGSGRNLSHLFRFESLASNLRRALHAHVQINLPELTVHWHTWRAEAVTAKACLPFNLHPKELELV